MTSSNSHMLFARLVALHQTHLEASAAKSNAHTDAMHMLNGSASAADFHAAMVEASVAGYTALADVLRQLATEADGAGADDVPRGLSRQA